jgi:trans-2-enoyl-CoA reductase
MKTRSIVFRQHGAPPTVAHLETREFAPPGPGEALVEMLFAPIHPADLNTIEGTYARKPPLEHGAVPGGEGVGRVAGIGAAVEGLELGQPVLLPSGIGTWCEACVVPVDRLVPAPPEVPLEQAAMLRVNPATAFRMLADFEALQPGDWVLQNAANSAVGRAVIQIARHQGLRTLNVVRRLELVDELRAIGGDAVLLEGEDLERQIPAACDGAPLRLALNAVGGESALRLAKALAPGGTLVTYGAMARQPLRIPNALLIFRDLCCRGFWMTRWYEQARAEAVVALFGALFSLARQGILHTPVEKVFPLEQIEAALIQAAGSRRSGKILLRP